MNEWATRKTLEKKMKMEAAGSHRLADELKRKAYRDGSVTKRVRNERPATAAKRERAAFYGKFNPANPISDCCSMMVINAECSGCGEIVWWVEALNETQSCDMTLTVADVVSRTA